MLDAYLKVLDLGYYEVKEAFIGLADDNVWRRPADGLLSIGELAGHVAYWEAVKFAGEGNGKSLPDVAKCPISSPLIESRFAYYTTTIEIPPLQEHRAMTAEQVCDELLRVHAESAAAIKALNPDMKAQPPGWPDAYTYDFLLTYACFHVSYHTGQIYSARHLLGETTPDN